MDEFILSIKQQYAERILTNQYEQWPPVSGDKLINLQLVETDKKEGYQSECMLGLTKGETMPQNEYKSNKGLASKVRRYRIDLEDLFEVEKKKSVRKVIVEGNAGMGKTTLCTMLAEGWALGNTLTQFNCVLLFPLRKKSVSSAKSLLQLLEVLYKCKKVCKSVLNELLKNQGNGVLIIADGWDELDPKNRSNNSFIHCLLFGDIMPFVSVLLTSRPSASGSLFINLVM